MNKKIICAFLVCAMTLSFVAGFEIPTFKVYADTSNQGTLPNEDPDDGNQSDPGVDPQGAPDDPDGEPDPNGTPNPDPDEPGNPTNDPEPDDPNAGIHWIDNKCYIDGVLQTGLCVIEGKTYIFDDETGDMLTLWQDYDGNTYYLDPNTGVAASGKKAIGDNTYIFDDNSCALLKGLFLWHSYYYYANTSSGKLMKGVRTVDGKTYLFNPTNFKRVSPGFKTIDGKKYYINSDCTLYSGWKTIDSKKYYFSPSTYTTLTGFQVIDGKHYYFYKSDTSTKSAGSVATGTITVGGNTFYCYKSTKNGHNKGEIATGWVTHDGKYVRYYYKTTTDDHVIGQMAKGIVNIGDYTYGFDTTTGNRVLGWHGFGGNNYYFYQSTRSGSTTRVKGNMARSTTIDGKKIDANGVAEDTKSRMSNKARSLSSETNYLILTDVTNCRVGIYKGAKNNWELVKYWKCSPGKKSTPTVIGTYSVKRKGYMFISEGIYYCYYYTVFYGNYYFHSILYSSTGKILDGRLGQHLSHGCVRLAKSNAHWIYNNVPIGSKVVTYK